MKKRMFIALLSLLILVSCSSLALADTKYCVECGKPLAEGAKFCGSCGTKVGVSDSKGLYCTNCGTENKGEDIYCTNCGTVLSNEGYGNWVFLDEEEPYDIGNRVLQNCVSYDTDVLKNHYDYNICSDCALFDKDDCYIEYLVNKEYDVLTGILYHPADTKGKTNTKDGSYQHFCVYGDGKLLYELKDTVEIDPVEFKVNITGVRILRIEIAGTYHAPGGFGFDPTLAAGNLKVAAK